MSKRNRFARPDRPRHPRDYYPTIDPRAAKVLASHLPIGCRFIEPCAGAGHLVDALVAEGLQCAGAWDLEPGRDDILQADAFTLKALPYADCFATNPPWTRGVLHPLIEHLAGMLPTWLLLDADWMHSDQAAGYMHDLCTDVVTVGRIKWIEGTKGTGYDNSVWMRFSNDKYGQTRFWGRRPFVRP